jgi:Na+-translocating ferredoxin:NAD+ oxidoreductase RnfA subunit
MIAGTLIAIALILGYAVAVGLSMAATFGITKAAPWFVVNDHLLKTGYKFLQELVWLLCVIAGAYVSAAVAASVTRPWFTGTLLMIALVLIPWTNTWDVRQRGITHQIVMSVISVAGVVAGFVLWKR